VYTIGQAATRAGVSVALLRAWQRRYGIVEPARTPAGYRLYDETALDRLRAMRRLVDSGWTASNAAAAILAGTVPSGTGVSAAGAATSAPRADAVSSARGAAVQESFLERFVAAAADLDLAVLEQVLDELFADGSYEQIVDAHLLPALAALGDAWAAGRLDVAAEHAASHAVQRRLAAAFQAGGRPSPAAGAILVGLPPGSRHELGALAFAVAARRAGIAVVYLGPDLPVADWVAATRRARPSGVVLGCVTDEDGRAAASVARALRDVDPDLVIAVGGRAAHVAVASLEGLGSASGPHPLVLPDRMQEAVASLAAIVEPVRRRAPTRRSGR
jgi:DNA-binding transcriptional MerR regulator/methylmalonyl-CoA mutase cobalamin-binding subunit